MRIWTFTSIKKYEKIKPNNYTVNLSSALWKGYLVRLKWRVLDHHSLHLVAHIARLPTGRRLLNSYQGLVAGGRRVWQQGLVHCRDGENREKIHQDWMRGTTEDLKDLAIISLKKAWSVGSQLKKAKKLNLLLMRQSHLPLLAEKNNFCLNKPFR